jgi:hypothetical protein
VPSSSYSTFKVPGVGGGAPSAGSKYAAVVTEADLQNGQKKKGWF